MSDLLQTTTGDLQVTNNALIIIEGITEIQQRVTQRLRTFYGEWFLNNTIGIKYFQEILKKSPNATLRDRIFKDEINGTPGIIGIESYLFAENRQARTGALTFRAKTISGNLEVEVIIP
jgi:hypothetical protein